MYGIGSSIPAPSPCLSCLGMTYDGEGGCGLEDGCLDLRYCNTPISKVPLRHLDVLIWRVLER
jgi:hypothetical protein